MNYSFVGPLRGVCCEKCMMILMHVIDVETFVVRARVCVVSVDANRNPKTVERKKRPLSIVLSCWRDVITVKFSYSWR